MSSLKDLSLRNFMWKQVPMANISNTDTEGHESGMTRAGSVVRSGAGWVVDGIFGPRSVFTLACHVSSASKGVKEISR